MTILSVVHKTRYRYARPVQLGEHRLMCRPRDSHDLRLLDTSLAIEPAPARLRWLHDPFGNSIAVAAFEELQATELLFDSRFRAEHFPAEPEQVELEPYAAYYPFHYNAEEMPDLVRTVERHYPDPERRIDAWARAFVGGGTCETLALLGDITRAIHEQFKYARREEIGTQTPLQTLELGAGSCRDFALFMMEAARSLGFAARFVSGYLYDAALIGAAGGVVGGGATHAWAQIYLPGAGWIEFDPTNAMVGGRNLIRVAVARDAAQAAPLTGTYTGVPEDFLGMTVEVAVTAG